jgi:ribosomal protein S6--L-glutamate ligase
MKLFFLTATRVPDVPSPLLLEVTDLLRRRGHEVGHATFERTLVDVGRLVPDHDLYLLKSHTELSLSLAALLDEQGARLLNPFDASAATQDKLRTHRRLEAAGVPVPRTLATGDYSCVCELLDNGAPLVLKPVRGHRGAQVEMIRDPSQLRGRPAPPAPVLVQRFVDGPGEDLKVYVVGSHVWAVRKPFGPLSFTRPGHAVSVSHEVEGIALSAGAAMGLAIYGLDVIESPDGPVVVDLNYFPGYKGCTGVAAPMAAYIDAYARGLVHLQAVSYRVLARHRATGTPREPVG